MCGYYVCMPRKKTEPEIDRFMRHVNKNGSLILETPCWEWTAGCFRHNYGHFVTVTYIDGKRFRKDHSAHRWLWEFQNGSIPPGKKLCHRCDNSLCVRSDHMFIGSQLDNIRDMDTKGRRGDSRHFGEKNASAKLTREKVEEIRMLHATGKFTYVELGERYGVSEFAVRSAVQRKTWV